MLLKKPRICTFDLRNINDKLIGENYNVFKGSLGNKVKTPNERDYQSHYLLLNHVFPFNIHEYDVFIIDLDSFLTIDFSLKDNELNGTNSDSYLKFASSFPQTLFDPRPYSAKLFGEYLKNTKNDRYLMIIFSSTNYYQTYRMIEVKHGGEIVRKEPFELNIYDFHDSIPYDKPLCGKEMIVASTEQNIFTKLLEKQIKDSEYNQTYKHLTRWSGDRKIKDKNFFPLLFNQNQNIVSYYQRSKTVDLYMFPQFFNKADFLIDFLNLVAPLITPELFPYANKFLWKKTDSYRLPNEKELLREKEQIKEEYQLKTIAVEKKIERNEKKYSFLHDILTESGDELVKGLITYFKWLGFKSVIDVDDENNNMKDKIKEEDIQIEIDEGLLIVEVKGIRGTSTDSECSQISKIKHRRCKMRNSFDVYALYIVNHQRHLPPIKRKNPPFTQEQLDDALNDERGLLTTWQLYNLYFQINSGVILKSEARKNIIEFGLVKFKPSNLVFIDEPKEFFEKKYVCIVNIDSVEISVGEILVIEKDNMYRFSKVVSLQINGKPEEQVSKGEIGIKFNEPIEKKSIIWKKALCK